MKTFKERRQQKFLDEHPNISSLGQQCEKPDENLDTTITKNRNEMIAVTTSESSELLTAINMREDLSEKNHHHMFREVIHYIFWKDNRFSTQ